MMKSGSSLLNAQLYRDTKNNFKIVLFLLLLNDAFGAETQKAVSVKEGKDVALLTGETEIQREDNILWTFGDERMLLAEVHLKNKIFETYDSDDGRFKGKLELDRYTGSLIIHNTQSSHSGVYHMKIIKKSATIYKRFDVTVGDGEKKKKKIWESLPLHDIVNTVSSYLFAGLVGLVILTCVSGLQ
ncbi:uncharacterized protein LOC143736294 [Siphateles boraxobius]|uniref:uncharacterized protein LOC143736294 n=1 Tax=Siphateles boraxobius TaxID=180520 RepID=UPI0040634DBD